MILEVIDSVCATAVPLVCHRSEWGRQWDRKDRIKECEARRRPVILICGESIHVKSMG